MRDREPALSVAKAPACHSGGVLVMGHATYVRNLSNCRLPVLVCVIALAAAFSLMFAPSASATAIVMAQPDAEYLARTTRIDFVGATEADVIDHVSDGSLTVSFPSMLKFTTPNSIEPYAKTWGYAPLVESTLNVPYVTTYGPVEFTLSEPATTFGLEAYNGYTWASDITVTFLSAASETIATITKYVAFDGYSWDARLFAITSDTPIAKVRVQSSNNGSVGYGQFRYALAGNHVPVASPVAALTTTNAWRTIQLTATDQDVDPLTYRVVSQPSHGNLTAAALDKVTYLPEAGYTGSDSFKFVANDGKADSNVATVYLTVVEGGPYPPHEQASAPYVPGVVADGEVSAAEYAGAFAAPMPGDPATTLYISQDGSFLHIALAGAAPACDVYVYVDPENHGTGTPLGDDRCFANRMDGWVFTAYPTWYIGPDTPGYNAHFQRDPTGTWSSEFAIPYSALGVTAGVTNTIGINVGAEPSNGVDIVRRWPEGSIHRNLDTWAQMTSDWAAPNHSPVLTSLTVPSSPLPVNTLAAVQATFTDSDAGDAHTAVWDWGDGTSSAGEVIDGTSGTISGNHVYAAAGVYTVRASVTDRQGASTELEATQYIVVYDPLAGFVTGGGWFESPAGAYAADPTLVGKASFGFVSKYVKGSSVPTGKTEFQFHVAGFTFSSASYDWLVVSGCRAQYKGEGTINGAGQYKFMLTCTDGLPDRIRIKIWDASEGVVYDNQLDAADTTAPATAISGGNIVVHRK